MAKPKPKTKPAIVLPNSSARGTNLINQFARQLRILSQGPTLQGTPVTAAPRPPIPAIVLPNSRARGTNLINQMANQLRIATQGPTLQGAQGPRVTNVVAPPPRGLVANLKGFLKSGAGKGNTAEMVLRLANAIQDQMLDPETLALKQANSYTWENRNKPLLTREQLRQVNTQDPMMTDQQLRDLGHVVPRTAEENAAIKARHDKLRAELPYDEARAARNTGGGGGGGGYSAAAAPVAPPKTQYQLEQEKLGSNASQSEMDRVRDIGLQMFVDKYGGTKGMERAVAQAQATLSQSKQAAEAQPVKDSTDIKTIGAGATQTFGDASKSIDQSVEARNSDVNKAVDMNSFMRIRNGGQTADPTEPKRQVALSLSRWLDNA